MSVFEDLKSNGAEVKTDKKNQLVVGFTSQIISNNQLFLMNKIEEDCVLAFYGCDFSCCDLALIIGSKIEKIAIFYSKFSDRDLLKLSASENLKFLKLFDTQVTDETLKQVRRDNGGIEFYLD